MKYKTASLAIMIMAAVCYPVHSAADDSDSGRALRLGASWTGDMARSLAGGLRQGSAFLGMARFSANLDTELSGLWRDGLFGASVVRTIGAMPSSDMFGDAQVTSNIEAGEHTFLMEFWVRQRFGTAEITAGLQDLNTIFAVSESGALFLNSSFGIMPVITGNLPAPVYPLTSPGISLVLDIGSTCSLAAALFDGRPTPFESNPFNTRWKFTKGDGIIALSEFRIYKEFNGFGGEFKAGVFTHNHFIEKLFRSELPDTICSPTVGAYLMADQTVWRSGTRQAALFMQAGYTPSRESFIDLTAAMGVNVTGLFAGRENDAAGLAVTTGRFTGGAGCETAIELTYRINFNGHTYLQPDLQYIIHPSGRQSGIPHCLACFLRFGVSL